MRLLIITQTVDRNDAVLGFMHGWLSEFAKHCEKITVIALGAREYDLPVKVLSLGKGAGKSKLRYLLNFYKYIWQEQKNYDIVFVHMNPEYVIMGGLLWKIWGKKIALWYMHKRVDLKLRLAEKLVDIIFTASDKSFRLQSEKVNIVGHGIDLERFTPASESAKEKIILNVDRIAPAKNQLEIVKMFKAVKENMPSARLWLVGAPARRADEDYFEQLKKYVRGNNLSGQVKLLGAVANRNLPHIYQQAKVFVNFSATGSLDKTVLEAMACNLPVVTTNEAFKDMLSEKNYCPDFMAAVEKVIYFLKRENQEKYRELISREHDLKSLVVKVIKKMN